MADADAQRDILLLLLNALFVAAEFAIVGVRGRRSSENGGGDWRASSWRACSRRGYQDRFIATAQLGITLASLGLGMYGEHLLAEWLADRLELSEPHGGSPRTRSAACSR